MTVRSTVISAARPATAGTFLTIYTCPPGRTAIIKYLVLAYLSGTSSTVFAQVASGGQEWNIGAFAGAFPTVVREHVWIVLEPGDQLRVWQTLANSSSWYFSGAELAGVAPP